jgi:hypothetical protein
MYRNILCTERPEFAFGMTVRLKTHCSDISPDNRLHKRSDNIVQKRSDNIASDVGPFFLKAAQNCYSTFRGLMQIATNLPIPMRQGRGLRTITN